MGGRAGLAPIGSPPPCWASNSAPEASMAYQAAVDSCDVEIAEKLSRLAVGD